MMKNSIPVILFAYARPDTLKKTLQCLKDNNVPIIYAFSDGPRTIDKVSEVVEVRKILHAIDWCEITICERDVNYGLGRSIFLGVTEVLQKHESAIIFEDDLICVPGTYQYLCAALIQYQKNKQVMSITGWTHPLVTPSNIIDQPYFDGRAECWVWGTWARAWKGLLNLDAMTLMNRCKEDGIDVYRYGSDLVDMAKIESVKNIWAVRFIYWHILHGGLCLRPPWSMVESIGFDERATNTKSEESWTKNPPLRQTPQIPDIWPKPVENPECPTLWQKKLINNNDYLLYYMFKQYLHRIYHLWK